ncbi:MAG: hypothetical protein QW478_11390 [Candidatus Micrarchaeaceae archaeon]
MRKVNITYKDARNHDILMYTQFLPETVQDAILLGLNFTTNNIQVNPNEITQDMVTTYYNQQKAVLALMGITKDHRGNPL